MTDKLEKLTRQIYEEGIDKAKQEAEKIIKSAEEEKRKILRSAREEAQDINTQARKEADDLKTRVESEMRMAIEQSLALLRQKITDLICLRVSESSAEALFDDVNFLQRILETVMKEWISSNCKQGKDIYIKLPENTKKKMQDYFAGLAKKELNKGIKIEFDKKIKGGFVLRPEDGAYRIGFTEKDFQALIEYFLRPRIKKLLFEKKGKDE